MRSSPSGTKNKYWTFPYTTPGALFRKSMLLDGDFLNSAPGLYTENSGTDKLTIESYVW